MTEADLPRHVGLIPDGTRRWARARDATNAQAYDVSIRKRAEFAELMFARGVQSVSLYCLSRQNLGRSPSELAAVFQAETAMVREVLPQVVELYDARVTHAGLSTLLPDEYAASLQDLVAATAQHAGRHLSLLVGYDPWDEIAARQPATGAPKVEQLWIDRPLDLVIRTGGQNRLSNFAPLQSGYAELIFDHRYFNDLEAPDFEEYLREFAQRERHLGL